MTDKSLKQQPLPATARQIKAALAARLWTKPGYRIHHVRPHSPELIDVHRVNYFAGAARIEVSDHTGMEMLFFSDDSVARVYFYFGRDSFKSTSVYLWSQLARHCSGVLDIGGYTGLYSLLAASVAPRAKIIGFEPVSHIAERFRQNAEVNAFSQISVRSEAISDFNAAAELRLSDGYVRSMGEPIQPSPEPAHEMVEVQVRSVDSLDQEGKLPTRIDLIKIDTEGDEYQTLDGARLRISKDRPLIFAYVTNDEVAAKIAAFANSHAYSLHLINEEARSLTDLMPNGDFCLTEEATHPRRFGCVLLCPDDRAKTKVEQLAERFAQKPRILNQVSAAN